MLLSRICLKVHSSSITQPLNITTSIPIIILRLLQDLTIQEPNIHTPILTLLQQIMPNLVLVIISSSTLDPMLLARVRKPHNRTLTQ